MRRVLLGRALGRGTPTAVIDANLLRRPEIVAEKQDRYRAHGEQVVITDVAWADLVKNDRWESTLRASFRDLAQEPDAVVASWSLASMIADEHATGERAAHVVHPEMTAFLRRLVVDFAADGRDSITGLRAAIREHGVTHMHPLAGRRKDATRRMVELSRRDIPAERWARVTKGFQAGDRRPLVDVIAEAFVPSMLAGSLVQQDVLPEVADRLRACPTVTSVHSLMLTHMGLEWTASKGIENAKLERIYNDLVDVEYAVIAWLCGGEYVTEDKRALRRFEEVLGLLDRIWP